MTGAERIQRTHKGAKQMYTTRNFKTKKELKAAVEAGELLEALKAVESYYGSDIEHEPLAKQIRAAIAKAEGK
jgi:guanylate kinase